MADLNGLASVLPHPSHHQPPLFLLQRWSTLTEWHSDNVSLFHVVQRGPANEKNDFDLDCNARAHLKCAPRLFFSILFYLFFPQILFYLFSSWFNCGHFQCFVCPIGKSGLAPECGLAKKERKREKNTLTSSIYIVEIVVVFLLLLLWLLAEFQSFELRLVAAAAQEVVKPSKCLTV